MDHSLREKIINFLQWHRTLYGETIYTERIDILMDKTEEKTAASPQAEITSQPTTELQIFKSQIENCTRCALHKNRTKFVFGVGNEHADIMFIGEAPGRDEDLQGEPFVGRAGQLLNQLLGIFKLRREDVYIANILKCRPPGNRDPLPEEVEKCIPYLHRQIELIQPKLLVALGRVAAQNLLNTKMPLGKMRNQVWEYRDIPMIVTYHPAAILRNMNLFTAIQDDFKRILSLYQQLHNAALKQSE